MVVHRSVAPVALAQPFAMTKIYYGLAGIGSRGSVHDLVDRGGQVPGVTRVECRGRDPDPGRRAEPEPLSRAHGPAALQQLLHGRDLLGQRYPDAQAGAAVAGDPAPGERVHEGLAPLCVRAFGASEEVPRALARPEVRRGLLQQVADPAGAEQLAPLDPADREGITGHRATRRSGP